MTSAQNTKQGIRRDQRSLVRGGELARLVDDAFECSDAAQESLRGRICQILGDASQDAEKLALSLVPLPDGRKTLGRLIIELLDAQEGDRHLSARLARELHDRVMLANGVMQPKYTEPTLAEVTVNLVTEISSLIRSPLEETAHNPGETYEALHPETRSVDSGAPAPGNKTNEIISPVSAEPFTEDTASKLGVSQRTVQHEARAAHSLDPIEPTSTPEPSRERFFTLLTTPNGRYQARVALADGLFKLLEPYARGTTEAAAIAQAEIEAARCRVMEGLARRQQRPSKKGAPPRGGSTPTKGRAVNR